MSDQLTFAEALNKLIDARLCEVNTALPGVIVSYSNGRADIQPVPKKRYQDGSIIDFPILRSVRVCWPSFAGGAAGVKGPVQKGDKCLLIFSQQAVDNTDDLRQFDLSDAYCVMADLGNVGGGSDNSGMNLFFGSAFIRITASGSILINAPGGVNVTSPTINQSGEIEAGGKIKSDVDIFSGALNLSTHTHSDPQGGSVGPPR